VALRGEEIEEALADFGGGHGRAREDRKQRAGAGLARRELSKRGSRCCSFQSEAKGQ
jgi:hypothetical protein